MKVLGDSALENLSRAREWGIFDHAGMLVAGIRVFAFRSDSGVGGYAMRIASWLSAFAAGLMIAGGKLFSRPCAGAHEF